MTERIRIDAADLTLRELGDVATLLGGPLDVAMQGVDQARGIAAIACIIARRTNPAFTFDEALELRMSDLELVTPDPEAPRASNGASPPESAELGT